MYSQSSRKYQVDLKNKVKLYPVHNLQKDGIKNIGFLSYGLLSQIYIASTFYGDLELLNSQKCIFKALRLDHFSLRYRILSTEYCHKSKGIGVPRVQTVPLSNILGTSINDVPRFLAIFDLPTYISLPQACF